MFIFFKMLCILQYNTYFFLIKKSFSSFSLSLSLFILEILIFAPCRHYLFVYFFYFSKIRFVTEFIFVLSYLISSLTGIFFNDFIFVSFLLIPIPFLVFSSCPGSFLFSPGLKEVAGLWAKRQKVYRLNSYHHLLLYIGSYSNLFFYLVFQYLFILSLPTDLNFF